MNINLYSSFWFLEKKFWGIISFLSSINLMARVSSSCRYKMLCGFFSILLEQLDILSSWILCTDIFVLPLWNYYYLWAYSKVYSYQLKILCSVTYIFFHAVNWCFRHGLSCGWNKLSRFLSTFKKNKTLVVCT